MVEHVFDQFYLVFIKLLVEGLRELDVLESQILNDMDALHVGREWEAHLVKDARDG